MGAQISDLRYENGMNGTTQVVTVNITTESRGITKKIWPIQPAKGFRGFDTAFDLEYCQNDFEIVLRREENKMIIILEAENSETCLSVTLGFVTSTPISSSSFESIDGVTLSEELKNRIKRGRIYMEQVNLPFQLENECNSFIFIYL